MKPTSYQQRGVLETADSPVNRRRQPRMDGYFTVTISYVDGGQFILENGVVTNLSHGGIGLQVTRPLKPGMAVAMIIVMPNSEHDLCIPEARVSWATGCRFGVALQTLKADEQHRLLVLANGHRRERPRGKRLTGRSTMKSLNAPRDDDAPSGRT
jgi:hypothetical protein